MYSTSFIATNSYFFAAASPPSSAANGGIASAAADAAKDALDSTNAMWAVLYPTFRTSTFTTCIGHEDSTV